jgi:hypothetical protein
VNTEQLAQQIVSVLNPSNFKWGVGLNEAVLSRVIVGPVADGFFQHDFVTPCAVLHVESTKDHDEHPADLIEEQRFTLYIFAANASEQSGSAAIVGGNRAELGSSRGRGLLEIEPLVKAKIFNQLGLVARPRTTGGQPTAVGGKLGGLVAERALEIVATRIPSFPDYASIRKLAGSASVGLVTLTWSPAIAQYALVGYTWRWAAGATAPTTPTGGTRGAFVADVAATGLSDTPPSGQGSYSVFWAYDVTVDPFSGNGVAPTAPNAWSSFQTAQDGLVYVPASITVTA